MPSNNLSRRGVVAGGLAAGLVSAPFVRSANAAGSLTIGLWDHWVPGANEVQAAIIKEWADREKVDVKVDFITSQGDRAAVRPDQRMVFRQPWDEPAERVRGIEKLMQKLASLAA